jgi:hypothetical protein
VSRDFLTWHEKDGVAERGTVSFSLCASRHRSVVLCWYVYPARLALSVCLVTVPTSTGRIGSLYVSCKINLVVTYSKISTNGMLCKIRHVGVYSKAGSLGVQQCYR